MPVKEKTRPTLRNSRFQLGPPNEKGVKKAGKTTKRASLTTGWDLLEEVVEMRGEEVDWTRCLDDIACGVETRLDSLFAHVITKTIIERTTTIARSLSIPENQVEKWADSRRKRIERINILDSLLEKVAQTHLI